MMTLPGVIVVMALVAARFVLHAVASFLWEACSV
jgi:hypothetical protein